MRLSFFKDRGEASRLCGLRLDDDRVERLWIARLDVTALDEMMLRFNASKSPFLSENTMPKLIHSNNLEHNELTKRVA